MLGNTKRRAAAIIGAGMAAALAIGGAAAWAASASTITGKVVDENGQPVAGITVSGYSNYYVDGHFGETVPLDVNAVTDANGVYTLDLDYATTYSLSFFSESDTTVGWAGGRAEATIWQSTTCDATLPSTASGAAGQIAGGCAANPTFVNPVADSALTADTMDVQGQVALSATTVAAGDALTVSITNKQDWLGDGQLVNLWADHEVYLYVYSDPVSLGKATVSNTDTVSVTLPKTLAAGSHKIAAYDQYGNLIGWAALNVTASGAGGLAATGAQAVALYSAIAAVLLGGGAAIFFLRRRAAARA